MTRSKFFRSNGVLTGFSLSGHSGAGEAGEDIVCAAVSSAAYMTANTLTDVYRFPAAVRAEDGRMTVELSEGDAARCRELMEGFYLHLSEMQKQYPHNVQVSITEV
ncbi:MAG TPA: ribosomal-processing cysteine protease Prp [Firmicutes bacterium]|nr:ribosomal-processing cysteine protease Prp [Bacillota bacterium]